MLSLAFPLQTQRLFLHPLLPSDRDAVQHLYSDWAVAKWLSRLAWPFTPESAVTLIAGAEADLQRGAGLFLALTQRSTGAFVGTVSLRIPAFDAHHWTDDTELGILGYAIAPEHQRHGFATEAAERIVELAFTDLHLVRLRAMVLHDNVASRRVLERLQFRLWRADVGEAPRSADTYVLDRTAWLAARCS